LIGFITAEQNRAVNMMFLKFSNYRRDNPFSNTFGKVSLVLLRDFSPDELANMDTQELVTFIANNGNNRFKDIEGMALEIKTIAKKAYSSFNKII